MSPALTLSKVLPGTLRACGLARTLMPRRVIPPLWREAGAGSLLFNMVRDELRGEQVHPVAGEPVLLIPGLFAGDASLAPLASTLREQGWTVCPSGIRVNVGCSDTVVDQLVTRLEEIAADHDGPVALVGHSRGGLLARAVAQQRPDLVSGVVTLGSPQRDQLAVHPLLWANVITMLALGTIGVPGVMGFTCMNAYDCCHDFQSTVRAPLPDGVSAISLYSRRDGVVDWRACMDPAGTNVEVEATHCGMPSDPATMRAIVSALASFHSSPDASFASMPELEPVELAVAA
ncbi:MAG: lipase family alpha/beta hydrolase [Solirubrobacteraceae bacterium]